MTDTLTAPIAPPTHKYVGSRRQLLIDGQWVDAVGGRTFKTINPATEEVICEVAEAGPEDVDRAVKAARKAFESGEWPALKPMQRERLLHKLADLIEANAKELAELESMDNGKAVSAALARDLVAAQARTRYMAGWASKLEGRTMPVSINMPGAEFHAYTVREPVGVVGAIIAWNFPLQMCLGKIAPALAAGCTVVLKPAENTPLTALRVGELILEAGFPAGVVNIVTGYGSVTGQALIDHPDVNKISFTGSTAVGKIIAHACANNMTRFALELGGKSPVIIGPDADLDVAITGAANAIFGNMGQVCVAGSRLYIDESIYKDVVDGVAEVAKKLKIGPGYLPDTQQGPLVSEVQMNRVLNYIEAGKSDGGTAITGGERHGNQGWYVKPTVFTGLTNEAKIVREEIFGPVVVAQPYKSIDDIAAIANDTTYGLAASIWTKDLSFAHRLARRIKAGTVWVNCHSALDPSVPFGGYKQSGMGRESGEKGIEMYTENKSVIMKL